jgi:hypothetical protein
MMAAGMEHMGQTGGQRIGPELNASGQGTMSRLSKALHDLCQPLTTLQCRLELASALGTAEAHREAVELGAVECLRLMDAVAAMREIVCDAARGLE